MSDLDKKNKRVIAIAALGALVMLGASFAAVPLYDLFCRVTGYGGTTQVAQNAPDKIYDREIKIRLNGDVYGRLNWDFGPVDTVVPVNVGGKFLTEYRAANNASRPTAGTAIYNVTPAKAGRYFHKIACFCFDEQTLAAGQEMRMPVSFFLDPSLMADDNMDDVTEITLSYTFFPAKSAELEQAKANNPPPQIEYDPNRYN